MDRDGKSNAVGVGVDDRDGGGLRVGDVNLVAHRIYGHSRRVGPDLEGAILAEIDQVEHRDGVGGPVTDVGVFVITSWDVWESAVVAAKGG